MIASLLRRSNSNSWKIAALMLAASSALGGWWIDCCQAQDRQAETAPETQDSSKENDNQPLNTLIVVVGAGGSPEFTEQFNRWADDWAALANQQNWRLVMIGKNSMLNSDAEKSNQADGSTPATELKDSTTKDAEEKSDSAKDGTAKDGKLTDLQKLQTAIEKQVDQQVEQVDGKVEGKRLWLVLIGHGTAAGKSAKFNLSGPDVTTSQLKDWLDRVKSETIVIDCTSSSAPFLVELSNKNRIVVSATRSGAEFNFARFGGYMSAAVRDLTADLDHDREVSLLEAFLKASKETERFYRENSRIATEHALLEDNSDKTGTGANFYVGAKATSTAAGGKALDGKRAARVILWASPQNVALSREQAAERDKIEAELDTLRERKKQLSEKDYFDQLEKLMLKMAELYSSNE